MKRTRDEEIDKPQHVPSEEIVGPEHDPSLDPITCEKWRDPRVFMCGHVWDGVYIERPPFKMINGCYECTTCKFVSQTTVPLKTDCIRSSVAHPEHADIGSSSEPRRIADILEESRIRRRGVYLRCMNAFYRVIAEEMENHHWRSSIHPKVLTDPCFMFNYSTLKDRGVFQSPSDFVICITYRNGTYENFLSGERIRLKMGLQRKDRTERTNVPDMIAFQQDPSKFSVTVSCIFTDGYDGEADDELVEILENSDDSSSES